MRSLFLGCAAGLVAWSAAASAQFISGVSPTVILSGKYGRGMTVGGSFDAREFLVPATLNAAAIAGEFRHLCLDTAGSAFAQQPAAMHASALQLAPSETVLPATRKVGGARPLQWVGSSARLSVWSGDDADLTGRPVSILGKKGS